MKGRIWGGTVLSLSLAFFVFAGGSYGEEKRKSAPAPAHGAQTCTASEARPADGAETRTASQARSADGAADPRRWPDPLPRCAHRMAPRPRPPEPMHANVPGPAVGRAGGIQAREDLHRKMAVQVSRQENLRAQDHYRVQRAMFRPMPHPVRFSPAAHRALFGRVRMVPAHLPLPPGCVLCALPLRPAALREQDVPCLRDMGRSLSRVHAGARNGAPNTRLCTTIIKTRKACSSGARR